MRKVLVQFAVGAPLHLRGYGHLAQTAALHLCKVSAFAPA
eukprot:CAMPEP_0173199316 /NCGR_PEP_ID=MMETSP1141-20130122/17170_1 /TAXON_ID=483371 /ORGANISM="non described non described, Strain CCMP2298" /LENGTH=39 /DNA_ID= /DNA_START= /DNA_END= /DNA_ORIENTATION=